MQIYFLQPVLIIFTRDAINFDHDLAGNGQLITIEQNSKKSKYAY